VFVLYAVVWFLFFFVGEAQAVVAVEIPSGACPALQVGWGIGAELYTLADALVLRAIHEGERAVRAGAVGTCAGVIGEDGALGAGELVAGEAGESPNIDTKANIAYNP
jgi:hypothetical protein